MLLQIAFAVVPIVAVYWLMIRPALVKNPTFAVIFADEQSIIRALRRKVAGAKQRIAGGAIVAASAIVEMHDFVAPAISSVDLTPLTKMLPDYAWPLISIAGVLLLQYLRGRADKRNDGGGRQPC